MAETNFEQVNEVLSGSEDLEELSVLNVVRNDSLSVELIFDFIRTEFLNELSKRLLLLLRDSFSHISFELVVVDSNEFVQELRKRLLLNVVHKEIDDLSVIFFSKNVRNEHLLSSGQKKSDQLREVARKNGVQGFFFSIKEGEEFVQKLEGGGVLLVFSFRLRLLIGLGFLALRSGSLLLGRLFYCWGFFILLIGGSSLFLFLLSLLRFGSSFLSLLDNFLNSSLDFFLSLRLLFLFLFRSSLLSFWLFLSLLLLGLLGLLLGLFSLRSLVLFDVHLAIFFKLLVLVNLLISKLIGVESLFLFNLSCDWGLGGGGLKELVHDCVDLSVEDLGSDEGEFVATVVSCVLLRHLDNVVDELLQLFVIEKVDELLVQVLELLQDIIVVEQFVDGAVLAAEQFFN